jgi:hypothetical protein
VKETLYFIEKYVIIQHPRPIVCKQMFIIEIILDLVKDCSNCSVSIQPGTRSTQGQLCSIFIK